MLIQSGSNIRVNLVRVCENEVCEMRLASGCLDRAGGSWVCTTIQRCTSSIPGRRATSSYNNNSSIGIHLAGTVLPAIVSMHDHVLCVQQ